jgi:hypothetical protein
MTVITKRRKSAFVPLVLAIAIALVTAFPASAVYNNGGAGVGYGGSGGTWLGSYYGKVACVQHSDFIRDAGPFIGRSNATAFRNATQVIYKQTRLERLVNGRWILDRVMPWRSVTTFPGQYAQFGAEWFMFLTIDGVYRVQYDIRWYVNNQQIGWAYVLHHANEIDYAWSDGARIISNGCTMDVGPVVNA